jgi:surface-anchored protein
LYLGNNAEHTAPDAFDSYVESDPRVSGFGPAPWIRLQVMDVRGPGAFFVWQTDSFGQPTVFVNTLQGVRPDDRFFTFPGGHIHYSWGFSAAGVYQVDLQSSAYLSYPDQPTQSAVTTFTFCVEAADNAGPGGGARAASDRQEGPRPAGRDDFLANPIHAAALGAAIDQVVEVRPPSEPSGPGLLDPRDLRDRDAPGLRKAAHKPTGIVSAFSTVAGGVASELEDRAPEGQLEEAGLRWHDSK